MYVCMLYIFIGVCFACLHLVFILLFFYFLSTVCVLLFPLYTYKNARMLCILSNKQLMHKIERSIDCIYTIEIV